MDKIETEYKKTAVKTSTFHKFWRIPFPFNKSIVKTEKSR